MGGLVVYEEVVFICFIAMVVAGTLREVFLQLLHQISVSSLIGSVQHCHSRVFYVCVFGRCLLLCICQVFFSLYLLLGQYWFSTYGFSI